MDKNRIKQMADTITQLKAVINPLIMEFTIQEWKEIKNHLGDRLSTVQGGAVITEACGGNSRVQELKAKFQCEMIEAIYSYAKHLNEAEAISRQIKDVKNDNDRHRAVLSQMGLM
jgi:hypothetical protein